MQKNKNSRTILSIAIIAVTVLAVFIYLSFRSDKAGQAQAQTQKITPVQEVLLRNLESDYPPSPKEVVKYYSEISRCFYGEDYSEDEFHSLAEKSRELFDPDLVANQTDEQYLVALKADVDSYKAANKVISSYSVSSSTDVDYYDYLGDKWAQLYCVYSMRVSTSMTPVKEKYLLRKDPNGHWKIYGWILVEDELLTGSNK